MEKVSRLACLTLLGFILSQAEAAPLSWKASGKGGAVAAGGEAAAVAGLEILASVATCVIGILLHVPLAIVALPLRSLYATWRRGRRQAAASPARSKLLGA